MGFTKVDKRFFKAGAADGDRFFWDIGTGTWQTKPEFVGPDGTVAVPAFSFKNETNTGFYRNGPGGISFASQGTKVFSIGNAQGFGASGALLQVTALNNGGGALRINITGNTSAVAQDVLYGSATSFGVNSYLLRLLSDGTNRFSVGPLGHMFLTTTMYSGNYDAFRISWDAGTSYSGVGVLVDQTGTNSSHYYFQGRESGSIQWGVFYRGSSYGGLTYAGDGSAAYPSYSFINDPNTGIYSPGADQIGFTFGGVGRIYFRSDSATFTLANATTNGKGVAINFTGGASVTGQYALDVVASNSNIVLFRGTSGHSFGILENGAIDMVTSAGSYGMSLRWSVDTAVSNASGLTVQQDVTTGYPAFRHLTLKLGNTIEWAVQNGGLTWAGDGSVSGPSYSFYNNSNTGIYSAATNILGFSCGGIERARLSTNRWQMQNDVLIVRDVNAGIVAGTTQAQGQVPLTAEINEVATVANPNDVVTLPAAEPGLKITVINNGANTLQVFPATGDDLGAGVDVATTIASGAAVTFLAYDATNWKQI